MQVPVRSSTPLSHLSDTSRPLAKVTVCASPSRTERAVNSLESIFTAFTPTPFRPTVFLNASPEYLPPVFILLTAAESDLSGMPRP